MGPSEIAAIIWRKGWKKGDWEEKNPGAVGNIVRTETRYFRSRKNPNGTGMWYGLTELGITVELPLSEGGKRKIPPSEPKLENPVNRLLEGYESQPEYLDALSLWAMNNTSPSAGYALEENRAAVYETLQARYSSSIADTVLSRIDEDVGMLLRDMNMDITTIERSILKGLYPAHLEALSDNVRRLIRNTKDPLKLLLAKIFKEVLPKDKTIYGSDVDIGDWAIDFDFESAMLNEFRKLNLGAFPSFDALLSTGILGKVFYRSASGRTAGHEYVMQLHVPYALSEMDMNDWNIVVSPSSQVGRRELQPSVEKVHDFIPIRPIEVGASDVLPPEGHIGCSRVRLVQRKVGHIDGPRLLDRIVSLSESFIKVIDPYIDGPTLLRLLDSDCADIRIINTRETLQKLRPKVRKDLFDVLNDAIQDGRKIAVRSASTENTHDRIWITRDHAWGFSSSIKDLTNWHKTSLVFYLDEATREDMEEECDYLGLHSEPIGGRVSEH